MDNTLFFSALALVLVFEGLMPALFPSFYRKTMAKVALMPTSALRSTGVITMISGAIILYLIRS
ncbi:MAG: DUF2065 domain-containing protein [Gammaproteobacteria bacterium]|nr:DUF2065 domain-containing protein [Gammaproteobacteria bacterium]